MVQTDTSFNFRFLCRAGISVSKIRGIAALCGAASFFEKKHCSDK